MKILPAVIVAVLISATILALWLGPGYLNIGKTSEDTLALLHCTGDSFAFIQGTYLYPVTEEEIAAERQAVIQRFRAGGGQGPRAGGEGGGGRESPGRLHGGIASMTRGALPSQVLPSETMPLHEMRSKNRTGGTMNIS